MQIQKQKLLLMENTDRKYRAKRKKHRIWEPRQGKQVRSDNDASELDILGHSSDIWGHMGRYRKTLCRVWST